MSEKHVVFGTGQVGHAHALIAQLARSGKDVRAESLHHPKALPEGVDWRAGDATDPDAAADASKGPSVIYQCFVSEATTTEDRCGALPVGMEEGFHERR